MLVRSSLALGAASVDDLQVERDLRRDKIAADGAVTLVAEPCMQVHGVSGFTRESKVQYYVKTFVDLAQRPLSAARVALMVWQDATYGALAGATR
jgi:alkylation response protein AidB-like acyl-CoA dehydrogenase